MKDIRYVIFNNNCTADGTWYTKVPNTIRTLSFDEFKKELINEIELLVRKNTIKTDAIKDAITLYDEFKDKTIAKQDIIDRVKDLHPDLSEENIESFSTHILDNMYYIPSYRDVIHYRPIIRTKSYLEISYGAVSSILANLKSTHELIESFVEEDVESEKWEELYESCCARLALHIAKVDIKED